MSKKTRKKRDGLFEYLAGKKVLVTGGTGSFGQTFVRQCLENSEADSIIVYSRDEQKHVALQRVFKSRKLISFIGDVRDYERLRYAMKGVHCVFNAAAIKHVHFTEEHPIEAVLTNVLGAQYVCQAALDAGVEVLVTLSTDKAVEPVNVMGMSKALQERLMASYAGHGMRIGIIRYGNVLASNGSVVPLFQQILERGGGVLPVTDRRMTRFVLTLKDSVHLVLYALNHCRDGDTFVLDLMAMKIWDLAHVMAKAWANPSKKVKIEEVGIRPGEKLHETLISSEEMRRAKRTDGIWVIRRYRSGEELFKPGIHERSLTSKSARMLSKAELHELLLQEGCLPKRG